MENTYQWIDKFKQELDKLNANQADYEQVQQLRKIKRLWDHKYKSIMDEMTAIDGASILTKLHNEIMTAIYNYILDYIALNDIPMNGISLCKKGTFSTDRERIIVLLNKADMKSSSAFNLGKFVNEINVKKIIKEMTGVTCDTCATHSIYNAFQDARHKDPDWHLKYCADIKHALDLINEDAKKTEMPIEEEW